MVGEHWDYGRSSTPAEWVEAKPIRLLLVEDRRGALDTLADFLRAQGDIVIDGMSDSGLLAGVRAIFDAPDAVLVSADLVGFGAWDTARLIKQLSPAVSVLVIGAGVRPCGWLRHTECPDAIVEQPGDYAAIIDLIRSIRARRCATPSDLVATQTLHRPDANDAC
jgi:DNA-binding NarL/FixJ family response regulator